MSKHIFCQRYFFCSFLMLAAVFASGCVTPQETAAALAPGKESFSLVKVLYATDRSLERADDRRVWYNGERGPLRYGSAEVSVPSYRARVTGELNRPAWYRFEFVEDPEKHFVIMSANEYSDLAAFQQELSSLAAEADNAALVYVHGFNVGFDEALMRTAQLAWDTGFPGTPVAYVWPSRGDFGPVSYNQDQNYADLTVPSFKEFLVNLKVSGVTKIHVIAHSMGNKVLLHALKDMPSEGTRLSQVIMAAPDVSIPVFREQLRASVAGKAERFTIYASEKDVAMRASRTFNDFTPLGDATDGLTVVDGFETIDASDIDTSIIGHDYAASERELIMDIFQILKNDLPPVSRNLRSVAVEGGEYWILLQ